MKSFPLTPKQTVVFLPNRINVKTSPYYGTSQYGLALFGGAKWVDLLSAAKEEFVWVDTVCYCTADEWYPMEDEWRLCGVPNKALAKCIENNRKDEKGK